MVTSIYYSVFIDEMKIKSLEVAW